MAVNAALFSKISPLALLVERAVFEIEVAPAIAERRQFVKSAHNVALYEK